MPFFRPPGYPLLIAGVWFISGEGNIFALKCFNILCHSISSYLTYRIASGVLTGRKAMLAAVIFACNPFSLFMVSTISTEPLTTLLFLLFVISLTGKNNYLKYFSLIISLLLIVSTRPEYFFVVTPILAALIVIRSTSKILRNQSLVALVMLLISIFAWGNANTKATGDFIPFTDAANYHLWVGSTEMIRENYAIQQLGNLDFDTVQYNRLIDQIELKKSQWGENYAKGSLKDRQELWWNAYSANVTQMGLPNYFLLLLYKGVVFWRPFLNPGSYTPLELLATTPFLVVFTVGFLIGLIQLKAWKSFPKLIHINLFALIVLTGVHMFQQPDLRYRLPIFLPISSILLSHSFSTALSKIRAKHDFV